MNHFEVEKTWNEIWKETKELPCWDDLSQLIYDALVKQINNFNKKKILEAGSGTGRISLRLARNGARVYLIDSSQSAINISKELFKKEEIKADFKCASIFKIPYPDNFFDIVWNAGVLEHFEKEKQIQAIKEMVRVSKKNGLIITFNPYSKAIFYRIGKWFGEKRGRWIAGYEKPVKTLKEDFKRNGIKYINEYDVGFKETLRFLGYIPYGRFLIKIIDKLEKFFVYLNFKGYLLVSIGKKIGD